MNETLMGVVVWLLGLCVGSFLNVVVYRLPLGLSVRQPTWSFCPSCRTTLAWYDNLPVLGWILLRARCRYCQSPISAQYPLVEAITGLLFVLVYFLIVVANARHGVGPADAALPGVVPLLAAWLVLIGVLIVCSAMDLVSFYIDPLVTHFGVVAGIVLTALWPLPDRFVERIESPIGAAAAATFVASAAWLWLSERRASRAAEAAEAAAQPSNAATAPAVPGAADALTADAPNASGPLEPTSSAAPISFAAATTAVLIFVALAIATLWLAASGVRGQSAETSMVAASLLAVFAAMVRTASHPREADTDLHHEIEAEAPQARRQAWNELLWLCVPAAAGVGIYLLLKYVPTAATAWDAAVNWSPGSGLHPLAGAAFAMHGAMLAAAAGWVIRLVFTFVFGREAFGLGDIYILAAAGACAGWDIALLGFLLSVGIALLAWIVSLFSKRAVMIAFGPPLALGFVLALWWSRPAAERAEQIWADFSPLFRGSPALVIGLFLFSGLIAVTLSRLVRRMVEPPDPPTRPPAPPADANAADH